MTTVPKRPLVVTLETSNPLDVTPEDLEAICEALAQQLPEIEFQVAYEDQHGAGVTWFEVVHIFVPDVENLRDNVYSMIIGVVAESMRRRFLTKTHGKSRPRSFTIYDENTGEPIESFIIREASGPLERDSNRGSARRAKPRAGRHRERPKGSI